ncbi:MAG: SDR family NAD(P)-dependent oxidoreductase [Acidimicrobiales bacterium]
MPRLSTLSRSVAGEVAIITGAASGMGRATALLFADEGARVVAADLNGAGASAVAQLITDNGGTAMAAALDVASADAIAPFVESVVAAYGAIDILVNNAGVSIPAPIDAAGWEDAWMATLAVNLSGEARLARACLPHLLESAAGRIINVASTEGLGATAYMTPYTASKHGVVGLTRGLAVELGRTGITVNCICPGPIDTGMTAPIPADAKVKFARRRVPLRRYGQPEEVAHATLSLALPASSFINGAVLVVDGGMLAQNT